ncbi:hypothetical protein [Paracholeplasma manati]|uniref:DRTGG domain-containing protein n=1 Tax=Paracholeplasma manati TaxID=591373 RepID=A0ABT2Y7R1_9MOLU|nr:hypothetical protein [Paracholeplasma manati]MCV2232778.1 hypothetical protein [Paracholeplasma manati]MDG0887914.1 hypothetical protein [Paracholeplasma manati]
MKLNELMGLMAAKSYTPSLMKDKEINFAFCSDLMSDALVIMNSVKDPTILEHTILITGLATQQSIRTAEMLDVDVVLLVRGKIPSEKVILLAHEAQVMLLSTDTTMFNASGILFEKGIRGVKYNIQW